MSVSCKERERATIKESFTGVVYCISHSCIIGYSLIETPCVAIVTSNKKCHDTPDSGRAWLSLVVSVTVL